MKTLLHVTTFCKKGVSPVLSGKRATEKGFKPVEALEANGTWGIFKSGNKPIYSGIFFADGTHMTWNYNPSNPSLPEGVKDGDSATINLVGVYEDDEVGCLVVSWNGFTHQP